MTRANLGLDRRFLRASDLGRLRGLRFVSRRVSEGQFVGRHRTHQRGRSVDFSDYRAYVPGDAIRDVDWKVYGRSDRWYVKQYDHHSDLSVMLLVDGSRSMAYSGSVAVVGDGVGGGGGDVGGGVVVGGQTGGEVDEQTGKFIVETTNTTHGGKISKYERAAEIASAISFLMVRQQDRVGLGVARGGLAELVGPASTMSHLHHLLDTLEQVGVEGCADLGVALHEMGPRLPRRSVLIVISDLLENVTVDGNGGRDDYTILDGLAGHRHRGGDVIVFHVQHPDEIELPAFGRVHLVDSETRARLQVDTDVIGARYNQHAAAVRARWSTSLQSMGVDYQLVTTAGSCVSMLSNYLVRR